MTRSDITPEAIERLLDASLDAYDGALRDGLANAASGPDRLFDYFDFRPSEIEPACAIVEQELAATLPAIRGLLIAAMTSAVNRIATELPHAPMRVETVDELVDEVRGKRVAPSRAA